MTPRISHYKIVVSGHIVEAFQYAKPIGYNLESSRRQAIYRKRRSIDKQEITQSSLSRTKNRLIRLINANSRRWFNDGEVIQPQFLTYTFAENITSVVEANPIFTNYIKRLNYRNDFRAKYTVVPEFQKRGAVHYHAVFFNLPMINNKHEFETGEFASVWKQGFIKKKDITHVPNVGLYMTKYMTKEATDKRLVGKKKYFSSRGLIKPRVISQERIADEIMEYLSDLKPIHAYINNQTSEEKPYVENPTFCATYNLDDEQLSGLKSFYTLDV